MPSSNAPLNIADARDALYRVADFDYAIASADDLTELLLAISIVETKARQRIRILETQSNEAQAVLA